jgi:hypothetical protein
MYSLFDNQTKDYMHTGRNSETREDLKESMVSFLNMDLDSDDEECDYSKETIESLALIIDCTIEEHSEPIPDPDE